MFSLFARQKTVCHYYIYCFKRCNQSSFVKSSNTSKYFACCKAFTKSSLPRSPYRHAVYNVKRKKNNDEHNENEGNAITYLLPVIAGRATIYVARVSYSSKNYNNNNRILQLRGCNINHFYFLLYIPLTFLFGSKRPFFPYQYFEYLQFHEELRLI